MISRQVVLNEHISKQGHRLRERACAAEIVVGHQIAFVILGASEPVVLEVGTSAADVEVCPLDTVVHVAIPQGKDPTVNVDIMRGRRGGSVKITIGVELAKFDGCLTILGYAGQAVVILIKDAVLDVEVRGPTVVPNAGGIERSGSGVLNHNPGDVVTLGAAELPASATTIAGRITARGVSARVEPKSQTGGCAGSMARMVIGFVAVAWPVR